MTKMDDGKKPYLVVLLIQCIYAGMFLLSKAAFDVGMNSFIFVFYRQAAATVSLAPIAFFIERKNAPHLTFITFCKIFVLSLIGITFSLNIYGVALIYTSATLAAATANCLPVITFVLAVFFRMEGVKLRTNYGIAKVVGIAVCAAGAATIAFYRGPELRLLLNHHLLGHHIQHSGLHHISSSQTWVKGVFLMLLSNISWGLWLVLQGGILKQYPSKLLFTTLQCFLSSIQSLVIAIALERDHFQWKLRWNIRLLAVTYCGVMVTAVTFYLQAWVIEKKGPVFLAMSTPLALILTILCSSFLLGEVTYLGSILGGVLLVAGLYCVLWGKSREQKMDDGICMTVGADEKKPETKETMTQP